MNLSYLSLMDLNFFTAGRGGGGGVVRHTSKPIHEKTRETLKVIEVRR